MTRLLRRLLGRVDPCRLCDDGHFNECADARRAMEIPEFVPWDCIDGTHR